MEMFPRSDLTPDELKFFGLSVDPFDEVFDDAPYRYEELDGLITSMARAILANQIIVLIGESGSGKSTAVRLAEEEVHRIAGDKVTIVRPYANTARISDWVLDEAILTRLRGRSPSSSGARSEAVRNVLVERHPSAKTALMIDDAHRLNPKVFPHLRTLREFDTGSRLLSVILIGEPSLSLVLKRDDVKNVFGRSRIRVLPPLVQLIEKRQGKVWETKPERVSGYLQHLYNRVGHEREYNRAWGDPDAVRMVGELGQYPLNIANVAALALKNARRVGAIAVTPEAVNMVGARG